MKKPQRKLIPRPRLLTAEDYANDVKHHNYRQGALRRYRNMTKEEAEAFAAKKVAGASTPKAREKQEHNYRRATKNTRHRNKQKRGTQDYHTIKFALALLRAKKRYGPMGAAALLAERFGEELFNMQPMEE